VNRAAELRWACIAAGCIACAAGLATLSPVPVGAFWDDAVYVILGKAIATGEGYRYIHLPGEPSATLYPPLWPTLLSFVWRMSPEFPENVRVMKLLNPLLLGVAAVGATLLATRLARIRPWLAALVALACIAITPTLMVSSGLMSEPLGTSLAVFALLATTVTVMQGRTRDAVIAGLLVALGVLARSVSVVLVAGLAVGLLWKPGRRASAVSLAIALPPIIAWFLWSAVHAGDVPSAISGSYGPYTTWLFDAYRAEPGLALEVARKNITTIVRELGIVIFGGAPSFLRAGGVFALAALAVTGIAMGGRRILPLATTLVAYAGLVAVWPYSPGRFVWAFLPIAAVAVLAGITALGRRYRNHGATRVVIVVGAATLALLIVNDARGLKNRWHAVAIERNAEGVLAPLAWISQYTAPTDTIATDVHLMAYLYANRTVVPVSTLTASEYVRPKSAEVMRAEIAAIDSTYRPRWWVASGGVAQGAAMRAWAAESPGRLEIVAMLPGGGFAARARR
jgi:hypothetical protein